MTNLAVETRALVKRFGDVEAVAGVDLTVNEAEIFGFLGPNGAGKTTTINMLCTLLRPTSGTAVVAGFDVASQADDVRASIGLVFQDPSLDGQLTARENLQFHAMVYDVPRSEVKGRIDRALKMVGLEDRVDSKVMTFSGGMKRRLEIGRGIIHSPKVLFMDEPTQGLDPQTRATIWEYLKSLQKEVGTTLFMTTHYMDEAEYCDRIAIIDGGKIIASGTPAELKRSIGGDVVTLTSDENQKVVEQIKTKLGVDAAAENGQLHFEVANGAEFVPKVFAAVDVPIKTVTVRQPSLDDVFLKLTGRAIRDAEVGNKDAMRMMGRMWGGR